MQELKEKKPEIPGAGSSIDEDGKEPSPFKVYEDKYCSKCQDYHGCIGLIDSHVIKMQELLVNVDKKNNPTDGIEGFIKGMVETTTGMGAGQRFGLIATCMGAREHMKKHIKKPKKSKEEK